MLFTCGQQLPAPEKQVSQTVIAQADSFAQFITNSFLPAVKTRAANTKQLQALFLQARLAYKKFEWAAEYFTPSSAKLINGAAVPDIEAGRLSVPQGLQVVEGFLFPQYDTSKKTALIRQLEMLPQATEECQAYFKNIPLLNWQVFDAAKLEVFRIITLGITGFDTPLAENSMAEAACSLSSLEKIISLYDAGDATVPFNVAVGYLQKKTGFDGFNRAEFITRYANPLTAGLAHLQHTLHIVPIQYSRLLRQEAATLFDTAAFDVTAYAPGTGYTPTTQQIRLGERLFNDPALSGTGTRSCASCHDPAKAFADGLAKNGDISGSGLLPRNTPTLLNSALQPAEFYDMRVTTLEDQVTDVVQSQHEMGGDMATVAKKLWQNNTYRQLFAQAFPGKTRTAIDTAEATHAIAEYVRSLTKLNSRFDAYMRGDTAAMNTNEINGFNLFMGEAKCGTCHYMPLFNGTLPPGYTNTEPEVIGVPSVSNPKVIDNDPGRYGVVNTPFYLYAFKTPTVRNAAKTTPYMHNGVFATLEEVVDFYNNGGGEGLGIKLPNQTLPSSKLNLTVAEKRDLIAFIKCLDSK